MPKTSSIEVPLYLRIGAGHENQVATISLPVGDSGGTPVVLGAAAIANALRAAADELQRQAWFPPTS